MLGTVLCFLRIRVTNQPLSLGVGLAQPHLLRVWIGVGFGVCDPGTLTGVLVRSHVAQASTSARSQRPQPFKELGLTTSCLCLALRRVVPRCIGSLRLAFDVVLRHVSNDFEICGRAGVARVCSPSATKVYG